MKRRVQKIFFVSFLFLCAFNFSCSQKKAHVEGTLKKKAVAPSALETKADLLTSIYAPIVFTDAVFYSLYNDSNVKTRLQDTRVVWEATEYILNNCRVLDDPLFRGRPFGIQYVGVQKVKPVFESGDGSEDRVGDDCPIAIDLDAELKERYDSYSDRFVHTTKASLNIRSRPKFLKLKRFVDELHLDGGASVHRSSPSENYKGNRPAPSGRRSRGGSVLTETFEDYEGYAILPGIGEIPITRKLTSRTRSQARLAPIEETTSEWAFEYGGEWTTVSVNSKFQNGRLSATEVLLDDEKVSIDELVELMESWDGPEPREGLDLSTKRNPLDIDLDSPEASQE